MIAGINFLRGSQVTSHRRNEHGARTPRELAGETPAIRRVGQFRNTEIGQTFYKGITYRAGNRGRINRGMKMN
jgi:hypothetical protein